MRLGGLGDQRDVGAVGGGAFGDRQPDATAGAGDEHGLPGKGHGHGDPMRADVGGDRVGQPDQILRVPAPTSQPRLPALHSTRSQRSADASTTVGNGLALAERRNAADDVAGGAFRGGPVGHGRLRHAQRCGGGLQRQLRRHREHRDRQTLGTAITSVLNTCSGSTPSACASSSTASSPNDSLRGSWWYCSTW